MRSLADEAPAPGIVSPPGQAVFALILGILPGAGIATLVAIGALDPNLALLLFIPSYAILNLMHMAATWTRVYLAPGYANARPFERWAIPIGLAGLSLVGEAMGGAIWLFALQYYLSIHHGAMQNYGIVRASQRARGRTLSAAALRLDQAACLLPLMAALTYRVRAVSAIYDTAPMPHPPDALVWALAAAAAVAVVALVLRETLAVARKEAVDLLGVGVTLGVTGTWVGLIVLIEHPAIPFFAIASGHYVQYLWIATRTERGRAGSLRALPDRIAAWVSPAQSSARYLLFLAAFGALGLGVVSVFALVARTLAEQLELRPANAFALAPWGAAMLAVNLHHYWLDHRVWRSAPASAVGRERPSLDARRN